MMVAQKAAPLIPTTAKAIPIILEHQRDEDDGPDEEEVEGKKEDKKVEVQSKKNLVMMTHNFNFLKIKLLNMRMNPKMHSLN